MIPGPHPYHHGELRAALIEAGLALARNGGPEAVGLREVTRSAGVTPNAAYRHFADRHALVLAVALEAQDRLAQAMLDRMDAAPERPDAAEHALERLRDVGLGYIHFARSEPGWFELAFLTQDEPGERPGVTVADGVPPPYQLLLDALDALVDAGVLTAERRENAEWACWSTVHGFADLVIRGPLRTQPPEVVEHLGTVAVETIIRGLRAGQQQPGVESDL
ncbi:TetR/AcrR family transcriptional regulator [Compostimonas suwonensis]|uniref:AcrR family transcriptional regulator n=1 Tax=Compostimonas suwonensis TaxID=1048394 RepID=A0A2M9BZB5_9MICO|nr:TetR/AcrR family transcriptional regulator [Compostimonas suwonensis]PJJ63418.1 AcrR family transcriptional regulator [Compostimonas suwonensis]